MALTKSMLKELPPHVVPEAISIIDKATDSKQPESKEQLASDVLCHIASLTDSDDLPAFLARYNLDTPDGLNQALDTYIALRKKYPDVAFHQDFIRRENSDVTDTALFLIDSIVKKENTTDRYTVLRELCAALERKFGSSERLESNLQKLNLRSTREILYAIDFYFVMRKLYPATVFGRDRMRKVWANIV